MDHRKSLGGGATSLATVAPPIPACAMVALGPGTWRLRNMWRQAYLGVFQHTFTSKIPHHGVIRLRASRERA